MKCPHCSVGVSVKWSNTVAYFREDSDILDKGMEVIHGKCPECSEVIVKLIQGPFLLEDNEFHVDLDEVTEETLIYPFAVARPLEKEVPEKYSRDFAEACAVLTLSPQASAAISRRLLQTILRDDFGLPQDNFGAAIESFVKLEGVSKHIAGAIDAVRSVGNFDAHPLKSTNTGAIMAVEEGEAEWLLDVLESLFDFKFVQPARLQAKQKVLNEKLKALGKSPVNG